MEHTILIIEDSPTMRKLIRFGLQSLKGVRFIEASDGMDGLRKVTEEHVDLALIDINMPVLDGLALIKLIREDDSLARMPAVVITSEGAETARNQARALGADDYLTKPIQAGELRALVRKLLRLD